MRESLSDMEPRLHGDDQTLIVRRQNMNAPKFRPLKFGVTRATLRDGDTGVHYLRADQDLGPYPERLTDRLVHWAKERPDQTLFARREKNADGSSGDWKHISFAQALDAARRIGQGLLNRGLSAERPVLILSENDLEHALLALGCLYAGIPWCPTSPPYSLISQDYDKLKHVIKTLTPGLVFASDALRYGRAMLATVADDVELVCSHGTVPGRATTSFAALMATEPTPAVDAAMAATGPDTTGAMSDMAGAPEGAAVAAAPTAGCACEVSQDAVITRSNRILCMDKKRKDMEVVRERREIGLAGRLRVRGQCTACRRLVPPKRRSRR